MSDFQSPTGAMPRYSLAPGDESTPSASARTTLVVEPTDGIQVGDTREWKELLLSAKAAFRSGRETEALELYKLGLRRADKALPREQIVQFLRTHLWG